MCSDSPDYHGGRGQRSRDWEIVSKRLGRTIERSMDVEKEREKKRGPVWVGARVGIGQEELGVGEKYQSSYK